MSKRSELENQAIQLARILIGINYEIQHCKGLESSDSEIQDLDLWDDLENKALRLMQLAGEDAPKLRQYTLFMRGAYEEVEDDDDQHLLVGKTIVLGRPATIQTDVEPINLDGGSYVRITGYNKEAEKYKAYCGKHNFDLTLEQVFLFVGIEQSSI